MFFFSGPFYIITLVLQAICVIHCIRNRNQNYWIWLIIFLPLIGCIAYFFTEIFTNREIRSVSSGFGEMISPSGSVKKLEQNLKFSDTFNNRILLADAYLAAGQTSKSIPLYEGSLTGAFEENEYAITQLMTAYYNEKRFTDVINMAPKVYNKPQFRGSKTHILYAMSLAYSGKDDLAEKEFLGLKARFSNFQARYNYAIFLQMNNRNDEARQLLSEIADEIPQLSKIEKRHNREWINLSKEMLKKIA
jgi:hypothetical protein